jgi:acyl-CoA synthetase (AMP-forming)/AMP-acid ligase II
MTSMPSGEVGEIWIRSPSVAAGYWNRAEETEYTFAAHLADTGQGPFLRTGDLGFVLDGQLYVTGRIKDLIIIRGRNYYPQDIEQTVEASHDFILPNSCAAMSLTTDDGERLVIVAEIKRRRLNGGVECATHATRQPDAEHSDVIGNIRQAVSEQHELQTFGISLVARGGIPKTSSGKIQRHACRKAMLAGTLDSVAQWTLEPFFPCEGDRTQHPHQDQSQSQIRDPVTV